MEAPAARVAPPAEVYPGAPLRAVAIEVGFLPLLDALPRFGAFQRRRSSEFNRLYETSGDEREQGLLPEGREFERPRCAVLMGRQRERAVSVSRDHLAVITYEYSAGFDGFAAWALPMLIEGLNDMGVERMMHVSYRYENRIKMKQEAVDLSAVFRIALAAPKEARPQLRHVHLHWNQLWPDGFVTVNIDGCPEASDDELRLNITAHRPAREAAISELEECAREAHRRARLTFEELITSAFREQLRGKGAHNA